MEKFIVALQFTLADGTVLTAGDVVGDDGWVEETHLVKVFSAPGE